MNIKLTISYNGSNYFGYQIQKDRRTVEGELIRAIENTVKHKIDLKSAGRTDREVHAFGQVVNFKSDTSINIGNLPRVINYHLANDVSVLKAEYVCDDFHARFSAKAKHYKYLIYRGKYRNALYDRRAMHFPYDLDLEIMQKSLNYLIGEQDFKSFMGRDAIVKDTIRRIDKIEVREDNEFVYIDFYGKSFLKNMIRIIIGTAIDISRKKLPEDNMRKILEERNRKAAGPTAPSYGLYLMEVYY